ncbi:MAG: type I restriction enzyme HsdR N-terminal domain-containing protein [Bacteroidaceae bacterium]|nr:type I restriction enzyme HsdR N-terminal domain-containing protein [Bacteroidaceae bacterium]MBR5963799.1 type I restriction enzyme HsdR N-terminal domain-containing protein [Bacteroidaceae bacterium]
MLELNLPPFDKKIIQDGDKVSIFDVIRRRYVALTPEEWVRQHFVHFLIDEKGFPLSHMSNEVQVKLNGMSRRCDTVLYDKSLQPILIAEYKAPTVDITQKVFDQICRYNIVLHVKYLIVSNGLSHYCCQIDYENGSYTFLPDIPTYEELT